MKGKVLLSLCISFIVLIFLDRIISNTKIILDKDSIYNAKLPEKMKVAYITNETKKDFYKNIQVKNEELPEISDNEVLVYVKSASFTQRDFDFFKSKKDKKSFVPCSDFSGIIVRTGKNVKKYEIGDKVFGIADILNGKGACSQYISVPQNNIYSMPYSLSFSQAASIPTPSLLNWLAVHNIEKKGLKKADVLIDDAISETGIMLTGLLVRSGFKVTALDDENIKSWVSAFGVSEFVSKEEIESKKNSMVKKFDVVINLKYGLSSDLLMSFVKKNGMFMSFEEIENASKIRKDIKTLIIDNKKIDNKIFSKMARLVHLGKLQVNIVKEFDLDHIRDAYVRAEKGNLNGNIVVKVNK